ncbi:MAG: hypothetical protein GX817_03845 [Elusimicrobia bacterium]|nr:hypothetical protein [Elusimicrobiota bacterium]
MKEKFFLGINSSLYDSSAALVKDNKLLAFSAEERFSRKKHTGEFPYKSINFCLDFADISADELAGASFSFRPWSGIHRRLFEIAKEMPHSLGFLKTHSGSFRDMLGIKNHFRSSFSARKVSFNYYKHHDTHAASAYYLSPFSSAGVLIVDGSGESATVSIYKGEGEKIKYLGGSFYPHSLGYLYQAVTRYLGFSPAGDEGKVMGLAGYSVAENLPEMKNLVSFSKKGIRLNPDYFIFQRNAAHPSNDRPYFSDKFERVFGPPRKPGNPIEERHKKVAAGVQGLLEESLIFLAEETRRLSGSNNLAIGGGVALNSLANGKIEESLKDIQLFAIPSSGDDGSAIGAALINSVKMTDRRPQPLETPFLGSAYGEKSIVRAADSYGIKYKRPVSPEKDLAFLLNSGKIVALFRGRSESGPRALGHRSILATAADKNMKNILNAKVKHRESFRPFASVVPYEEYSQFFWGNPENPYMMKVARAKERAIRDIPSAIHVDGTAIVQSLKKESDNFLYGILREYEKLSGHPVLINTSFNLMGEPIVETPQDALECFLNTGIDAMLMEGFLFRK